MATIYRFIVENRTTESSGRKAGSGGGKPKKATGKGKWTTILGGGKGGVEHNRKLRAINPLLNRATGGWWEKGMRIGRAGAGLIKVNPATGAVGISPVAIAIILSFAIQMILKLQKHQMQIADRKNTQNYKAMENGYSAIHGEYTLNRNCWDGYMTYNENK